MGITYNNLYISTRFESIQISQMPDGTFCVSGGYRTYSNSNSLFTTNTFPNRVTIQNLSKEQVSNSAHSIIYDHLKTVVFPGATDVN